MPPKSPTHILSIQSHVVSGYVGNRAAVFPLQLLGYEVDILNSCMLANHTGYAHRPPGLRLTGSDLTDIISGLRSNDLFNQITHVLTGYIGEPSFLAAVIDTIAQLREQQRDVVFVCDPVLGDNGKLYVPREMVQVYIDKVIQHATIITPNAFELSLLAQLTTPIQTEQHAFHACDLIHDTHGVQTIFVTGTRFLENQHKVTVLVSSRRNSKHTRFAVEADYLEGHFTGTGDLMSALILAWTDKLQDDLQSACAHAMASVTGVLLRTVKLPKSKGACPFPELKLVQSQSEIIHPPLDLVRVRHLDTRP